MILQPLLEMKDSHDNTSEFVSDLIGDSQTLKQFVKKME